MTVDRYRSWRLKAGASGQGPLLDRLLAARGLDTPETAQAFLNPSLDALHDPFLLPDMDRAVELLAQAIRQQKKVVIHGDYDVDGLTASALLVRFLQAHGLAPVVVLPDRLSEGYGLTEESVKRVLAGQPDLLVTVDCGISSHEALSQLKQAGLDVVVTDHHECPDQLPEADAVINPKRPDSRYPFAALAGVGVVWKLIEACQQAVPIHGFLQQHLELVCLGTVGDLVPLVDENRVLVSLGLAQLNRLMTQAEPALGSSAGLWQLIRSALPEGQTVTARSLAFSICPRLNAAGRLGDASQALDLLLTADPEQGQLLSQQLLAYNDQRRQLEHAIVQQAKDQLDAQLLDRDHKVLLAVGEGWHLGVLGIVASRLARQYARPVIVLTRDGTVYRGSGRSWGTFDLMALLTACQACLARFGGHQEAAGLTVSAGQLAAFQEAVLSFGEGMDAPAQAAELVADLAVDLAELTLEQAEAIQQLEPFGAGNPAPLLLLRRVTVQNLRTVGQGAHLRLLLQEDPGGYSLTGIGFGLAGLAAWLADGDQVDVMGHLEVNVWNNRRSAQFNIQDLHPDESDHIETAILVQAEQLYRDGQDLAGWIDQQDLSHAALLPGPDDYRQAYRYLQQHLGEQPQAVDLVILALKLSRFAQRTIHLFKLSRILTVFEESGLLAQERSGLTQTRLTLLPVRQKVALEQSPTFQKLARALEQEVMA